MECRMFWSGHMFLDLIAYKLLHPINNFLDFPFCHAII
ncbi:hypothetical protein DESC_830052 [Desulfosarcina cetonica]|nr:hypothetical protein DESC_830052 [Desulfosarcina cetonica]